MYPFNSATYGRDVSKFNNPTAQLVGLSFIKGPDGHQQGAYFFPGKGRRGVRSSYALIPNNGCLDTRYSITITCWVYPEAPGPILHFNPNGWGLHLWLTRTDELFFRVIPRQGSRRRAKPVISKSVKPFKWNYISGTYDHLTGLATLWVDGVPCAQRNVGKFPLGLATNYPAVVGRRPGDNRVFRGRIACLQVYNVALTRPQIIARKEKCFRRGKFQYLPYLLH